jgi:hypothetical protein
VGLERDPLSLVSTIEELRERKIIGSGLENREFIRRDTSLGCCSSLADSCHVLNFFLVSVLSLYAVRAVNV